MGYERRLSLWRNKPGIELGCQPSPAVRAVRVEWRRDTTGGLDPLLVLGYPSLPNLRPGLDQISAELRQVARDFPNERDFLVLSSATLPGSSGGPVLKPARSRCWRRRAGAYP